MKDSCPKCSHQKWYKNKIFIVSSILACLVFLSYFFPLLKPFRESLVMYFQRIWWAILIGLVFAGIIDHFIPREYISHILSQPRKRTIFYSVILGFFYERLQPWHSCFIYSTIQKGRVKSSSHSISFSKSMGKLASYDNAYSVFWDQGIVHHSLRNNHSNSDRVDLSGPGIKRAY